MTKNTGKEYEEFVGSIQQSLINAEGISHLKNIKVEINKIIKDKNGIDRQFDVYWEFVLGGYEYRSVIECKDYASTISIDKIDAFIGKTADIPDLRLIYATKTGYQSGAKTKAEQHKINLLIVREPKDEDLCTSDGTPLINKIDLNIIAISPPRITSFNPIVDASWLKSQTNLNIDLIAERLNKKTLNYTIFIYNKITKEKISLLDLSNLLTEKIPDIQYGEGTYSEKLNDSYLESESGDLSIKLDSYELKYTYNTPITTSTTIDYTNEILGIVQNSISGTKQMVFKNGIVK